MSTVKASNCNVQRVTNGLFDSYAELPRLEPTVTGVPTVTGTSFIVSAGASVQTAINSAAALDGNLTHEVVIQANVAFNVSLTLPNKSGTNPTGTGWIIIRSANLSSLPAAGTRVTTAQTANMALLNGTTTARVIQSNASAHHYYLAGLEIAVDPTVATLSSDLLRLGISAESVEANISHHFTIDRCYIHGHSTLLAARGISCNVDYFVMVDSIVTEIHSQVSDGGCALGGWNCHGPWLVRNNLMEASGQVVFIGGADPAINGLIPGDLTFRYNHHRKKDDWFSKSYVSKNLHETKFGQRVLCENSVMENHYELGQQRAVNFKSENQNGTATWVQSRDIIFRYNIVHGSPEALSCSGMPEPADPCIPMKNVSIHDNIWYDIGDSLSADDGVMMSMGTELNRCAIFNNTFVHNYTAGASALMTLDHSGAPQGNSFIFKDNIGMLAANGVKGTSVAAGTVSLDYMWSSYQFAGNCIVGSGTGYPTGNTYVANLAAVMFTDVANDDYSLQPGSPALTSSTTGGVSGAAVATVLARTAGVTSP